MSDMPCMPGEKLTILAASLANSIAAKFDGMALHTLEYFFCVLGENLCLIASRREGMENLKMKAAHHTGHADIKRAADVYPHTADETTRQ